MGFTVNQLFLSNIKTASSDSGLNVLPVFYQVILIAYNKTKFQKSIDKMNPYDLFNQVVWLNENFVWKNNVFNFKTWIESGFVFVCDFFDENGNFLQGEAIYNRLKNKSNWIGQYMVIKKVLGERLKKNNIDRSIAKAVNVERIYAKNLKTDKEIVDISYKRSKFFCNILIQI